MGQLAQLRRGIIKSLLVASAAALPAIVHAGPIFGNGELGDFTGNLAVTDPVMGNDEVTVTVTLTNTSPAANGGFLTAFVLNNPNDAITGISGFTTSFSGTSSFGLIPLSNNGVNASPFGHFDFGASTRPSNPSGGFQGGGSPNTGLNAGESGTFTFTLAGPTVESLTQASFENVLSANPGGGGAQFFVARFRGFNDGGSDKVPGVPIPAAAWLLASGLIGLLAIARRRTVATVAGFPLSQEWRLYLAGLSSRS